MMGNTMMVHQSNRRAGMTKLLTANSTKIEHSNDFGAGYLSKVMYLAPADASGRNVCPWYTAGCKAVCLGLTAGRMRFDSTRRAQLRRTALFFDDRPEFMRQLEHEIRLHIKAAHRKGLRAAVRLNGTSDILWEKVAPWLFTMFPNVQFYDYSKAPEHLRRNTPANYHLTFSLAETDDNQREANNWIAAGRNVAVVFDTKRGAPLPLTWRERPVIDADVHDMRFLDAAGIIAGLRAKGDATKDTSGFVQAVA
jgi:hypothetical protein